MRLNPDHVNLTENTEDTSVRRVSTTLPTTDTSKRVYHLPTSLNEVTDQCTRRFDMSSNTGHQENDKDTFSRCVPLSFLTPAAGCHTTMSTLPSTHQQMTHYVALSGVDYHRDHEESVEMSIRRSLSSPQHPCTHGRRNMTSVTSTSRSINDMSNSVHNPSVGLYEPT